MPDKNKIRIMTKIAIFETENQQDLEAIHNYYRSDYISAGLLKNFFRITIVFLVGFLLWGCYNMEDLLQNITTWDIMKVVIGTVTIYGVITIVFLIITYLVCSKRFLRMQKKNVQYHRLIDQMEDYYDAHQPIETGGRRLERHSENARKTRRTVR